MTVTGTRVSDVSYDEKARSYRGAVTYYTERGIRLLQVETPGNPGWGYQRTLDALLLAAEKAARSATPIPKY